MIAQFLSNMELYLSAGECNGLHKHRRNWHGRRESHPHKTVLETAALLMYHVRKINGATNGTRTRNPENHNLVLWPIEL